MTTERELPDVPEEIRSERLSLRAPHPDFASEMCAAVRESFAELKPWMEWAQKIPTARESLEQQSLAREAFLKREELQLILFVGDRIVGSTGLHNIGWDVPSFEIGYWVRTPDARRGYITEAVTAIEKLAFETLGARRVEIRTSTRNLRSRTIPERLGYELEGILRNDSRETDGRLRDTAIYSRTGDEDR